MKVKLKGTDFKQYEGKIVDVEVDSEGDFRLPENIREDTGRYYAFAGEYELVNEDVIPGGYTLEVQARDLIQLRAILDALPDSVLYSATLKTN